MDIKFIPIIPLGESLRAFAISSPMAFKLAFIGFCLKFGSRKPICTPDITPIPPSFATALASLERETPMPMPP